MDEPLIRDIPSIKKALKDAKNLSTLKRAMPLLRPALRAFGTDVHELDEAFADVDDLVQQIEELSSIPDRFNDLFASRGWIIYDVMNLDTAKAAIKKAEVGDVDGAETDLVEYYSTETVQQKLRMMHVVEAFRPRMPLAEKALTDYKEGRYHACVPVVLALLDGLVNELHEKRRGFFSENVDLTAWDSISAHSRGLNVLAKIFQKGRYKTTTELLNVPYRNGILHGMDLGYDNRVVAAKTWAALFATRDLALKAERGQISTPPEEPRTSWRDLLQQISENEADKKRIEQWQPRQLTLGNNVPVTGASTAFADGTPEQKLAEYLEYWKRQNYGYMSQCISSRFGPQAKKNPGLIRDVFKSKNLKSFVFTAIEDTAPAMTVICAELVFEELEREIRKPVEFRLINEDSEGNSAVRGKPYAEWVIVNWEVY
jgi:hypothetical protein